MALLPEMLDYERDPNNEGWLLVDNDPRLTAEQRVVALFPSNSTSPPPILQWIVAQLGKGSQAIVPRVCNGNLQRSDSEFGYQDEAR